MTTLTLNHVQRLNIYTLIGVQKASVSEMRSWWQLQDLIALDEAEQKALNYTCDVLPNGLEVPKWDNSKSIDPKTYEFKDKQVKLLKNLLTKWEHFTPSDRKWLEPLLDALEIEDAN